MATVFSLLCWGGKDGKTATMTIASPCVVTITNHGLRDGTGVVFTTTGSLPTGVTSGTTYYAKRTAANTFNLYDTQANAIAGGATGRVNTSGSQSGTHTCTGAYWNNLSSGDRTRYGSAGSERAYASISAWNTGRAGASAYDTEVLEIGEQFTDINTAKLTISVPSAKNIIISKTGGTVENGNYTGGTRTSAWHEGTYPTGISGTVKGYIWNLESVSPGSDIFIVNRYRDTFQDFIFYSTAGSSVFNFIAMNAGNSRVSGCFIISSGGSGVAVSLGAPVVELVGNVIAGFGGGVSVAASQSGIFCVNNMVTRCGATGGFSCSSSSKGFFYNNISVGNTTNWTGTTSGLEFASQNAGLSGEAWMVGTGSTRVTIATTDFATYGASVTATNDFRPASSASPQVETGLSPYGFPTIDLQDDVRPSYIDGTDAIDIGPYEWDWGNGLAPNIVDVAGSGIIDGTRLKIAKQSDGTEYRNVLLSGATTDSFTQDAGADISVYIYARKGSSAPFYHPVRLSATIAADGGLTYSLAGLQTEDIACASYNAQIDTDWTFNFSTGAITHASGTTRYSVQSVYSAHQNASDSSTNVGSDPLMHGTTPTQFELINSGDISDADLEDLYGGSIEFQDGTLWTNLWTTNTMAAAHSVYVVQSGSKYTAYWGTGPIDVLIKASDAGTLRDSGLVDVYARPYGYTYAYYQADLSAGGRVVAPLSTLEEPTTQSISSATAATYSDVAYTFGSTSQDLGEGGGAGTYYCRLDCANRTLDQVFARTMYDTRDASTTTLNGASGWKYRKAHSSYTANDAMPFGTYSAGFWTLAQGVWLDNVASADTYNYQLTDHAGVTHQLTQPAGAATATVAANTRIVLYNTTKATEIDNQLVSGAYSYTITTEADVNDILTLYYFKEGYQEGSSTMIWSGTTQAFVVSQSVDSVVTAFRTEDSITDYTTITEFNIYAPTIYIQANDADGVSKISRLATFYNGVLTTEDGARYFRGGMTMFSTAQIRVNKSTVGLLLENASATLSVRFSDEATRRLYTDDGSSIIAPSSVPGSIEYAYGGVPDTITITTSDAVVSGDIADVVNYVPSAATIAAATLAETVEGTTSLAESIRLQNAVLLGKVSGAGTGTETFRDIGDTKNRVVSTVDSNGNRTAVTLDGS